MSRSIGEAVVPALLKLTETLGPIIDFFAALITQEPGIVKVGLAITAVVAAVAFLGGPVTLGVIALGAALKALWDHFGGAEEGGAAALDKMRLAWDNLWSSFKDENGEIDFSLIGEFIGKAIKEALSKIGTWFKEAFEGVTWSDVLAAFGKGFIAIIKFQIGLLAGLFGDIDFGAMGTAIKDSFLAAGAAFVSWLKDKLSWVPFMGGGDSGSVDRNGIKNEGSTGGIIAGAGSGTSDSIPMWLSDGEFVVNAKQTKLWGPLLKMINAGGMASGGPVGMGGNFGGGGGGSFNFLQFTKGIFDAEATIDRFIANLDQTSPAVMLVKQTNG